MSPRLLITGSRDWEDITVINRELYAWWESVGCDRDAVLVHGGARGADKLAASIWARQGLWVEEYVAEWERWGKRAGYIRNAEMVNDGADACLAFIRNGSRGATMCASLASAAEIPTKILSQTDPALP